MSWDFRYCIRSTSYKCIYIYPLFRIWLWIALYCCLKHFLTLLMQFVCQDKPLWMIAINFSENIVITSEPYLQYKFFMIKQLCMCCVRFSFNEMSDQIKYTLFSCYFFSHYVQKLIIYNVFNVKHMCLTIYTWYNLYLTYLIYT